MSDTKRQKMPLEGLPAGLWVVATPLGNLMDLTERARLAIVQADAVLCEDTRRTSKLTAALGLQARLERYDAHAEAERTESLVERLRAGESLALLTDAGTPGISDPGAVLVKAAHLAGIRITPVPGPSAVTALLSVAGLQETSFAFRGFFPRKESERMEELSLVTTSGLARVIVWFESPERILGTLGLIAERFAIETLIVGKELTKLHEKLFFGEALDVALRVKKEIESEGARGEWCFALRLPVVEKQTDEPAFNTLQCLLNAGISASEAARHVSQSFGTSKRLAYEQALRLSGKK